MENIEVLRNIMLVESICLHYRKLVKSFSVVVSDTLGVFSVAAVSYEPLVI
jgi:hypothetical protein